MRRIERVGPEVAFVEEVGPRAADERVGRSPCSIGVARAEEAGEAIVREVLVPEILPVAGSCGEELRFLVSMQAACDFSDAEVIVAVFDRARAGTLVGERDVTMRVVIAQAAAAFLLRVFWRYFGILEHGGKRGWIVDARHALYVGVGDENVCVAAALGAPVVIADSCVRHVSRVAVGVDERTEEVALAVG